MNARTDGNCRFALATWMFIASREGANADDAELSAACAAVDKAQDVKTGDAAGQALIDRVSALVDEAGTAPADISALLQRLYGEHVRTDLGEGTRDERLRHLRTYQFQRGLPWLARIIERAEDGTVGPSWLLVERVTDQVRIMDPNPWDDIPEERALPTADFQVLWELDGCNSFALR